MNPLIDYIGLQRFYSNLKNYIDGTRDLASWHVLELADSYNTGGTDDIESYLRNTLPLATMTYKGGDIIRLKPLTVSVGPYTWSAPDSAHIRRATADVTLTFPDGSSLTKPGVAFTNSSRENGRIYAARPEGNAYIDTGLTLDYSYTLSATGHTPAGNQSVLIGAFGKTTVRTTLRILGGSGKVQCMWPGNQELSSASSGVEYTRMFTYHQGSDGTLFEQDGTTYNFYYSGAASGTLGAPILLFNEAPDADFSHGIIREAIIRDGAGNTLRHFQPWYLDGEIVMMDVANNNQVYRPAKGVLVEVTE